MAGLAMPLLLVVVGMDFTGETRCPSRDDVARELARLAPGSNELKASAEIERGPGGLSITLRSGGGALLTRRTVAASGTCAELATAVAVVITAWEGDLRPDIGPGLPVVSVIQPVRGPDAATVVRSAPRPPAPSGARPVEIGAALLGSAAGRDIAPGLEVEAEVGRLDSGLGLRLGATAVSAHAIALGAAPGETRWSRAALGLGLRYRLWRGGVIRGAIMIDGRLGVEGGVVRVEGAGFDHNYATLGFDPGLDAGLRVGFVTGRFAPFLEIGAAAWSGKSAVVVAQTTAERSIPWFELGAGVGLRFGRFR